MDKRLLMIVNPAAGMGRGETLQGEIAALYARAGYRCTLCDTQGLGVDGNPAAF